MDPIDMRCACGCHLQLRPFCDLQGEGCCRMCICGARIKPEYWEQHIPECTEREKYKARKYRRTLPIPRPPVVKSET